MTTDERPKAVERKETTQPKPEAFTGKQLDLFRSFICNNAEERSELSNAFFLWDSVPRYAVSRQQMDKIRKEKGFLGLQIVEFQYQQKTFTATIQAARIIDKKTGLELDYYPSANEELIEDSLRKIAAEQANGFLDQPNAQSGVVFTLHMLREEMKRRGHARSYQEIYTSLMILSGSMIEIKAEDGKGMEGLKRTNYFPDLTTVTKNKLADDPHAKWVVQFHPLVTKALNTLTYRQYNYAKMMSLKSQLARWIHKQLSLKHRSASLANQFTMKFSTIKRDSALLEGYAIQQKAIVAVDAAFKELETNGVLMKIEKQTTLGHRGKIEDVAYIITASLDFIAEMKAANKRENLIEKKL